MTAGRWQALVPQGDSRRGPGMFLAAVVLDLAAIALLGWLVFVGTPAIAIGVRHEPDGRWLVTSVAPGGDAWNYGIRPGMEIIGISPSDALPSGDWQSLLVANGTVQITIQRHDLPPTPEPLIVCAAALVAAILAFRYVPTVAWLLTLAPPAIASLNGAMLVDPPINLAFEAIGPLVAALFVTSAASRPRGRWLALGPAVVIVYLVAWLVAYAASWQNWTVIRDAGVLASLALGALGAATSLSSAIRRARSRSAQGLAGLPLAVAVGVVVDELVPGRTRTRLSAIERERARLATELHADVLPDLSDVIRSIEEGDSPRAAADRLRAISAELRELMAERRLSILEDQGLVPALEWLVEHVEARTGVRVELDVEGARLGAEDRPPREVEIASYRVCQEALDNALIHARPKSIRVRLEVDAAHARLEVADDGVGIRPGDEDRAVRGGHLGLVDMRSRAAAIGGALQVGRRPGGGTLVLLRWPA